MKQLFHRIVTIFLVVLLALMPAFALEAEEAVSRFQRAARIINERGLIAETVPITEEEIEAATALLTKEPERLYEVLNGFLGRMDGYSQYFSPQKYETSYESLKGYVGVGVTVRASRQEFIIESVAAHSSAETAGVQSGDRLIAVDGKKTQGLTLEELTPLLRGEAGTTVTILVERNGATLEFTMTRTTVKEAEVSGEELSAGVFYIQVAGFSSAYTPGDFSALLKQMPENPVLILDLRNNPGGVIEYALQMADFLLEERTLMCEVYSRANAGYMVSYYSDGNGVPLDKLIVLVNKRTASAAELLAGILQEVGEATLLGEQTYGKGVGQYHLDMRGGDTLVLTGLLFSLPEGGSWNEVGLTPDMPVEIDRMVSDQLETCTALDTETLLRFGSQGDGVYAMTERLHILGYLTQPTEIFSTPVLSALRAFQEDCGVDTTIHAHPETLRRLEKVVTQAAISGLYMDTQRLEAMELAQCAAAS